MTNLKLIAVFGLLTSFAVCQDPAVLTVQGVGGRAVTLSLADISKLPRQSVKAADHGATVSFEGVLLTDVLAKVDLPAGEKFHSTAASYYLLVEARDGYRAVFAWAELDATFMDKAVYVVTKREGKPLAEKDGPLGVWWRRARKGLRAGFAS